MSNLKMPRMTVENLNIITRRGREIIAYQTRANAYWNDAEADNNYRITHHGNTIAIIGCDTVTISNGGWDSITTADRLRRILNDNGIPFTVRINDYSMVLYNRRNGEHVKVGNMAELGRVTFRNIGGNAGWVIYGNANHTT